MHPFRFPGLPDMMPFRDIWFTLRTTAACFTLRVHCRRFRWFAYRLMRSAGLFRGLCRIFWFHLHRVLRQRMVHTAVVRFACVPVWFATGSAKPYLRLLHLFQFTLVAYAPTVYWRLGSTDIFWLDYRRSFPATTLFVRMLRLH